MEPRKTLTMNWDDLGDDDDDGFFESRDRLSCAVPLDLASSSDEDDEDDFDDPRMSFASAISSVHSVKNRAFPNNGATGAAAFAASPDYGIWMATPASITERRKRLLHGMGLDDNKEFVQKTGVELGHTISRKFKQVNNSLPSSNSLKKIPSLVSSVTKTATTPNVAGEKKAEHSPVFGERKTEHSPVSREQKTEHYSVSSVLIRSRSEGDIDSFSMEKSRREDMIGKVSKQRLTRTLTEVPVPRAPMVVSSNQRRVIAKNSDEAGQSKKHSEVTTDPGLGAFVLIKNLDTGKEFIVNECGEDGRWNRLSDLQTGKELTMEEFEKTVGHSRVVNELMRRANAGRDNGYTRKLSSSSYISRSLRMSKKRGVALLKNIKEKAKEFKAEREAAAAAQSPDAKSKWVRVRQNGKSHKEFSALHLCQEIQAHKGCIWTLKFSLDGHYLASGGEDKVIHVWEVQECEITSLRPEEGNVTPLHPSLMGSESPNLSSDSKKKWGKFGSKRVNLIPEYVHVSETVFSLYEKPYCSLQGHVDDVLDLSWSKSQMLLSSSTDKTVRLWDLETKSCLKMFAHNDFVTCIQFNPVDDDYFISGSLDAKVRIWNVPERQVVDWTDIHEMVTAISYTPDGQGALVGTHNGSCRTYSTKDCVLSQTGSIEIRHKKKSHLRKVTGFQFAPGKSSEVLVTSADSRIRILDGSEVVQKFRGFRNANSQIAASFSPDGRYIISASEDSQVFIWKHEEPQRSLSFGKGRNILVTRSHEHFQCKDVSIALTWPCKIKGDPPLVPLNSSKRHSKRYQASSFSSYEEDTTLRTNSKRMLPPLPKKNDNNHSATCSPSESSGNRDSFANSNRIASLHSSKSNNHTVEEEEDIETISRSDSGIGDSFSSSSASIKYRESPSLSASSSLSESSNGSSTILPSAWGMVIVTAGYGGDIRCYQNFGLPRRMRQPHLF